MENYYYYSEQGCVKIGNENFYSLLLNGKGEGSFWIHLCNKDEIDKLSNKQFVTLLSGQDINFYNSEKDSQVILKLSKGNYEIYQKKGDIFVCKKTNR